MYSDYVDFDIITTTLAVAAITLRLWLQIGIEIYQEQLCTSFNAFGEIMEQTGKI